MGFHVPEKYRVTSGPMGSTPDLGNYGLFIIKTKKAILRIIASEGLGWEHVSVSTMTRCPFWDEMCLVKKLFWDEEDCVIQYHPPKSDYVNNHPYVLHLWRPVGIEIPRPPSILVGFK